MQSVEVAGEEVDGDFDGVVNELRVGDQTALALYVAGQPRPTTRQELTKLNLLPTAEKVTSTEASAITRGSSTFASIGCATCHIPSLTITKATFSEPSQNANFRDRLFPAGQDPISRSLDPATAVKFDLTRDQPDNRVIFNGAEVRFGAFEKGSTSGSAIVRLYGDLKRHNMGPRLAEQVDEIGSGASTFLTENLWGVGSTPPYLHDGRATTLAEAILEHGGEAQASRDAFAALSTTSKTDVITFLNNQVLFSTAED
jgi:cytochrome c peroxidase